MGRSLPIRRSEVEGLCVHTEARVVVMQVWQVELGQVTPLKDTGAGLTFRGPRAHGGAWLASHSTLPFCDVHTVHDRM